MPAEIKRIDGKGCNGCYNLLGMAMPDGSLVNYCDHAFLVDRPKNEVLRMSYHIIDNPETRLHDCPIGE